MIMNIFKTKYKIENIDLNAIDTDSLGESLLASIPRIKRECNNIDYKLASIARIPHVREMNALEHCEVIIDLSNIKTRLMNLYNAFMDWSKGLSDQCKQLYIAYFIKRDKHLCKQIAKGSHYKDRYIMSMARNFVSYIERNIDFNKAEYLTYPFIHGLYNVTCNANSKTLSNKGVKNHDYSGNEK